VLCLEFIVFTATVDTVQLFCVLCGVYCGYKTEILVPNTVMYVEVILFTARVDIVQYFCVFCLYYCGYGNSRCSAILLCCLCSFCGTTAVVIGQCYYVVC